MNFKIISILIFIQLFRSYYFSEPFENIAYHNITMIEMETSKQLFM
jgi:hypothetical protein